MADRFLIAPLNSGLQTDKRPWLIADDAFAELTNAYVFRGRVRKRFGTKFMNTEKDLSIGQLYTRLRINTDTTDGAGAAVGTVPGATFEIGQMFSIGDEIFTVNAAGIPAAMLTTGGATTATYNTTTGAYVFAGAALATDVYFYPAQPVMGISNYEQAAINDEKTYAFDTQFAYEYNGIGWERLGTAVWTGSDSQFFSAVNYRGANDFGYNLFVTNFKNSEMKRWDDATTAWINFIPQYISSGETIYTARIIIPFKDRLLLLNTVEDVGAGVDESFPNRCRYSQNGSPVSADAFHQDVPGKGDKIDAPTREAIISAQILKDRLIVFFERSTWELVYTNNQELPFVWQQLNTELGSEATFSAVIFDKVLLGIGDSGIHACNGLNVERIDQSIPDEVFNIQNRDEGVFRVHGIRDFYTEMVYWTLASQTVDKFPNLVLVFNYITGSWAFNVDTFTAFGYYQNKSGITWEMMDKTWQESIEIWDSGTLISKFKQVIAGNQEGYVLIVDSDVARNAPALQITDISNVASVVTLNIINHNLSNEDFVLIEETQGSTGLNGNIYQVTRIDSDTIEINEDAIAGVYTGGGVVSRVSRIDILTKQYNFYVDQGKNATVSKVNFYVDKTVDGQITIDSFIATSPVSMLEAGMLTGSIVGTSILETSPYALIDLEQSQDQVWHPIYLQAEGETVQLRIYLSDEQLSDFDIATSDFELNAMMFHASPAGRLE